MLWHYQWKHQNSSWKQWQFHQSHELCQDKFEKLRRHPHFPFCCLLKNIIAFITVKGFLITIRNDLEVNLKSIKLSCISIIHSPRSHHLFTTNDFLELLFRTDMILSSWWPFGMFTWWFQRHSDGWMYLERHEMMAPWPVVNFCFCAIPHRYF
jgi:hypothetical protein